MAPILQTQLGQHIRKLRTERKISQVQAAKAANISNKYLCELEIGKVSNPSLAVVVAIADGMGVSLATMFSFATAHETDIEEAVRLLKSATPDGRARALIVLRALFETD